MFFIYTCTTRREDTKPIENCTYFIMDFKLLKVHCIKGQTLDIVLNVIINSVKIFKYQIRLFDFVVLF